MANSFFRRILADSNFFTKPVVPSRIANRKKKDNDKNVSVETIICLISPIPRRLVMRPKCLTLSVFVLLILTKR